MAILEKPSPHYPYNPRALPTVGVMFDPRRDIPLTVLPPVPLRPDYIPTEHTSDSSVYPAETPFSMTLPSLKKAPANFIPAPLPKADCFDRTSVNNTQPHTLGEFEMESSVLSGVDFEYAMLEKALRKDPAPAPPPPIFVPQRPAPASVLEQELYFGPGGFGDILGDDAVPPPSIPNMIKREDLDDSHGSHVHTVVRPPTAAAPAFPVVSPLHHRQQTESLMISQDSGPTETDLSSAFGSDSLGRGCDDEIFTSDDLSLGASDRARSTQAMRAPGSIESPASGMSMCDKIVDHHIGEDGVCSHPDEYKNLSPDMQARIDRLRAIISAMPRRKLRESLARQVTLEDVEPLMAVNRDELAIMLGLGVTTWKTFMHSLGVPRWPARALKSQQVKEQKVLEKRAEAMRRGDVDMRMKYEEEHKHMVATHSRRRKVMLNDAKLRVNRDSGIRKKARKYYAM